MKISQKPRLFNENLQNPFPTHTTIELVMRLFSLEAPIKLNNNCLSTYRRRLAAAFIITTVREQRPRSHHKGATGRV